MDPNLKKRLGPAVAMIAAVTLAVLGLPRALLLAVLAAVLLRGAWEWAAVVVTKPSPVYRAVYSLVVGALSASLWKLAADEGILQAILWVAVGWWGVALALVIAYPRRMAPLASAAAGILILVPAILSLATLASIEGSGRGWTLYVIGLVALADSGAYFAGRHAGRRGTAIPLIAVSPNKSWQGVGGGVVAVLLLAVSVAVMAPDVALVKLAVVSIAAALASIAGDLIASLFKRIAKLEDYADLIPGHGGLMDRIDALLAAAPVFLLGARLTGLL